jgi:hypothetical protein
VLRQLNKHKLSGAYRVYVEDEKCIDLKYFGSETGRNETILYNHWSIVLTWIMEKLGVRMWTGFIWLMMRADFVITVMNLSSIKTKFRACCVPDNRARHSGIITASADV